MKMIEIIIQLLLGIKSVRIGRGSRMAISTSKTRKIIEIIKNRRENGIREVEKGANPHS